MKQIFINLPVKNLEKSMDLYSQLGFEVEPLFTFEDQKCLTWDKNIFIMLQEKKSENAVQKDVKLNQNKPTFTLPVESLESVHLIVENGLRAGCTETHPMIDEGFMQIRTIKDFDNHVWGIIFLDIDKFKEMKEK